MPFIAFDDADLDAEFDGAIASKCHNSGPSGVCATPRTEAIGVC